jgi:nitroreductase
MTMVDLQALEIANAIEARQSSRGPFDSERPVPDRDLQRILEAARWAPTPHNMQNFEVVVVDDLALLEKIAAVRSTPSETFLRENCQQLCFSEEELLRKRTGLLASMFPLSWRTSDATPESSMELQHSFLGFALQDSPTLLIVLHDTRKRAPASEGDLLGIMSLGCVLQNMWLTATALGISVQVLSALSGGEIEGALHQILDIPDHMQIAFGCRLGYQSSPAKKYLRVRREVSEFTHYNLYTPRRP